MIREVSDQSDRDLRPTTQWHQYFYVRHPQDNWGSLRESSANPRRNIHSVLNGEMFKYICMYEM